MIYLISRAPRFSPNSVERDEAIFKALLMELALQGRAVRSIDEEALPDSLVDADLVVSMGRAADTLRCLAELETRGVPVLNSPTALLRNTRSHLDALACSVGVGVRSVGNTTDVACIEQVVGYPLWLKRGDATAQSVGDVRFVTDLAQLSEGLHFLADNGCTDFVAMEHVEGDLVKFYGVADTPFFHCTLPTAEGGFSKFGLEAHNGRPQGHPSGAGERYAHLRRRCSSASRWFDGAHRFQRLPILRRLHSGCRKGHCRPRGRPLVRRLNVPHSLLNLLFSWLLKPTCNRLSKATIPKKR